MKYSNSIIFLMGFAGSGKRTIGEAISKAANFRYVHHHTWIDPILNLFCDDGAIILEANDKRWDKINAIRDVIFSTITDLCPETSNFVISYEMIDQEPHHKLFYEKILEVVEKRKASFLPVRLICDENELISRVKSPDRKLFFKTTDTDLIRKKIQNQSVFYTHHKNELTIDTTNKSPEEIAQTIISHLNPGEQINVRTIDQSDIKTCIKLFYDSIHKINAKDYSDAELNAWAPKNIKPNDEKWLTLLSNIAFVAEINNKVVGFGDITADGHLERLYTHHDYQKRGIASTIEKKLIEKVKERGVNQITTEASITAVPFFEAHGYHISQRQQKELRGVKLTNYVMKKKL